MQIHLHGAHRVLYSLYYCGGSGKEDNLFYDGVYSYFDFYYPNTIIFFSNRSGYDRIAEANIEMMNVLQQIAYETGIIVHDLSIIGSSNGCYTAMKAVVQYFRDYGIYVNKVCCLDAGNEWNDYHTLTEEECDIASSTQTIFYLFEQEKAGTNYPGIKALTDSDANVWLVICSNGDHNMISENAYYYGIFSWVGDSSILLPNNEYSFNEIFSN